MAKVLDCGLKVSEFEYQPSKNVHYRTNAFGKVSEPPYSPSMGQIMSLLFFCKDTLDIK